MTEATEHQAEIHADASARRVARVYAEALLNEAQSKNLADEILAELQELTGFDREANPVVRSFFLGGVIGRGTRDAAIEKAFRGRANDLLTNFLLVLNDHDRVELLWPIAEIYRDILEERTGQVRVQVRTAVPFPDDQRERLVKLLRESTRREPVLELTVDPNLIGGIVVQVGDYLYDASVKTRLDTIQRTLFESSSYAIQSGRDRFSSD